MHSTLTDKSSLRKHSMAARAYLDFRIKEQASKEISARVLSLVPDNGIVVSGYKTIYDEVDISPALTGFYARGNRLCLPIVIAKGMPLKFRAWQPGGVLVKGVHNIDIPPESEPFLEPDVVLVPMLAFDAAGHRLGYGTGYYDRALAGLRATKKNLQAIGVAYAMQQVERIPFDQYDQKLDVIVTEKEVIRIP